jgi:uncharacterized protein (TIGR02271 family)
MAIPETVQIIDKDGLHGMVSRVELQQADAQRVFIRLENGRKVMVEKRLLEDRHDGSYYLPVSLTKIQESHAQHSDQIVLPVIEETLEVQKRQVEGGSVRVAKTVSEREVVVDEPLMQEHVEVNRVVVNQVVDAVPPIRYEGDTMIIPILEEVVVVEVRLMVREEVHIIRRREEIHEPQRVLLRREEVHVETDDADDAASDSLT